MKKEIKKESKTKISKYTYSVGRRKRSAARIRLFSGKGLSTINNMPIDEFFKDLPSSVYLKPFEITGTTGKYFVTANISGGGNKGQVGAFLHGLSRSLCVINLENRAVLKSAGLLTRDPRERERRKPGLSHGARAAKQSPKR